MCLFNIFKKNNKKNTTNVTNNNTNICVTENEESADFITFGQFGKFPKNKIDTSGIFEELDFQKVDKAEQVKKAAEIINFWENLIETNSQYLVNYFMSRPILTFDIEQWWDDWCFTNEEKKLDEDKLEQLRRQRGAQLLSEIDLYLDKENLRDIRDLYEKYLPYFDYERFINSINIEYIYFDVEYFNIQLSDRKMDFFSSAYERFDKNLQGCDWHNF